MGLGHWFKKHVTHKILPKGKVRNFVDKAVSAPFNAHLILRRDVLPKKLRAKLRSAENSIAPAVTKAMGKLAGSMASSVNGTNSAKTYSSNASTKPYALAGRNTGYTLDTRYRSLNQLTKAGAL